MKYREIITFEKEAIVLYRYVHMSQSDICQLPISIYNISLILYTRNIFKKYHRNNG